MEAIRNRVVEQYKRVEDAFKRVSPKCEQCKKLSETVHLPFHYILMLFCGVLLFVYFLFTYKTCFVTSMIFVPMAICFMLSVCKKEEMKNWVALWILFGLLETFANALARIRFFGVIKLAVFYYLLFIDQNDCAAAVGQYLLEGLEKCKEKACELCSKKCCCFNCECKDKSE